MRVVFRRPVAFPVRRRVATAARLLLPRRALSTAAAARGTPATMQAVRVRAYGGPDAMAVESVPVLGGTGAGPLGAGEVLVRNAWAGVNFIDVYERSGVYKPALPFTVGKEASGIVEAVGPAPAPAAGGAPVPPPPKVGDRVVWVGSGTYAAFTRVQTASTPLVAVPPGVSLKAAAAGLLQGLTAQYLSHSTAPVQPGWQVLIHAAAGGTGQLLVQMAALRGAARIVTTVSTPAKAQLVRDLAAGLRATAPNTKVEVYTYDELAGGAAGQKWAHAVYDSVAAATYRASLAALRPLGHLVVFGNASGVLPPIDALDLTRAGSVTFTRPSLFTYVATAQQLQERADTLWRYLRDGSVRLGAVTTYPLADAGRAHAALEARATTGKLLLAIDPSLDV